MATITPTWVKNQILHTSSAVAAGANVSDAINLDTNGYDIVDIQISIAFGATPDNDVLVEIFSSPDDGTTIDNIPFFTQKIAQAASTTLTISFVVEKKAYLSVKITNNDSTDNVTYSSLYAGRKWSSV